MADALIPQPHGGALRPAFTSGTGAAASRTSWKSARRQVRNALMGSAGHAAERQVELMDSPDDRVALMATEYVLKRAIGDTIGGDDVAQHAELSRLTEGERTELAAALATVRRLVAQAAGRIDGEVG